MSLLWRYREAVVWCSYIAYLIGVFHYYEVVG